LHIYKYLNNQNIAYISKAKIYIFQCTTHCSSVANSWAEELKLTQCQKFEKGRRVLHLQLGCSLFWGLSFRVVLAVGDLCFESTACLRSFNSRRHLNIKEYAISSYSWGVCVLNSGGASCGPKQRSPTPGRLGNSKHPEQRAGNCKCKTSCHFKFWIVLNFNSSAHEFGDRRAVGALKDIDFCFAYIILCSGYSIFINMQMRVKFKQLKVERSWNLKSFLIATSIWLCFSRIYSLYLPECLFVFFLNSEKMF